MLINYLNKTPNINQTAIIFDGAIIIGDVTLDSNTSVWFNSVIRADSEPITIGANTNIQDLVVIHTDTNYPTTIGSYVSVGHSVILHGCTIGNNTLIGMNATILNGAKIGNNCIIGANSLVTANTIIPDNSLAFGNPCKVIRTLTAEEIDNIRNNALHYVNLSKNYIK